MKPSSDPRRRSLSAIHAVIRLRTSPHAALAEALRGVEPGPNRSLITDLVYSTLRWLPAIDGALAPLLSDPAGLPSPVRDVLRVGTADRCVRASPAHVLHAWVDIIKQALGPERRLAPLVNAVLRRVNFDALQGAAALALAEPLHQHLQRALGEQTDAAARAMLQPGPLWLTGYAANTHEMLAAEGAVVRPGPIPGSWAVQWRGPLESLQAFRNGVVQPQNPASAAVICGLGPVAGKTVLDVGSGHGIKAAQLVAAGAQVIAVEHDAARIAAGRANLRRLGMVVEHVQADASAPLSSVPEVELALLDAPCSGTGTLRGHPEIKLRWQPSDSEHAAQQQQRMLAQVADRVRVGGRLLYSVCALGLEEGPAVITRFLASHPDWQPSLPSLPLALSAASVGGWILPDEQGLDGFYLALLERRR